MIITYRELRQYDKNNINYYINFPKLYTKNENDFLKLDMVKEINNIISDDVLMFMEIIEDAYKEEISQGITLSSLTEFQEGFNYHNVISISIEFSQIMDLLDLSYIKGYNYDIDLMREINLQDLFKPEVDYCKILKYYIKEHLEKILKEFPLEKEGLHEIIVNNLSIDCKSIFYFTEDYLILPFSSFEMDEEIMNLLEFKISFNKLYPYLSRYAIKKIVHKVIL